MTVQIDKNLKVGSAEYQAQSAEDARNSYNFMIKGQICTEIHQNTQNT